jgi:colanic acid biosynthesis protein WcaH
METSLPLIETRLYRKISSRIPIVCVDLLIWHEKKLLLVKRKNHPLKGQWWVVGGRILLGEEPLAAVHRKAKEEVGLDITKTNFVGYYSDIFERNRFEKTECQTVSLVFICSVSSTNVVLDRQSSAFKWAPVLPERLSAKLMFS